jgi:hypothetical protein
MDLELELETYEWNLLLSYLGTTMDIHVNAIFFFSFYLFDYDCSTSYLYFIVLNKVYPQM